MAHTYKWGTKGGRGCYNYYYQWSGLIGEGLLSGLFVLFPIKRNFIKDNLWKGVGIQIKEMAVGIHKHHLHATGSRKVVVSADYMII